MRHLPFLAISSAAVLVAVVPAVAASAASGAGGHDRHSLHSLHSGHSGHSGAEVIEMEDDCHPPTFNRVIGAGICDPNFDGDTTVSEFLEELEEDGEVGKWRFHPDDTEIEDGQRLLVQNVGGEFHTFTPVRRFGGGCVPELNFGKKPVEECARFPQHLAATGVAPGAEKVFRQTKVFQRYECLIHPWMRAVVEIDD